MMKVFSNTLGFLINFVMSPFTTNLTQSFQNVQKNIIEPVQENFIKPVATIPLNIIRNKVTCTPYIFDIGELFQEIVIEYLFLNFEFFYVLSFWNFD